MSVARFLWLVAFLATAMFVLAGTAEGTPTSGDPSSVGTPAHSNLQAEEERLQRRLRQIEAETPSNSEELYLALRALARFYVDGSRPKEALEYSARAVSTAESLSAVAPGAASEARLANALLQFARAQSTSGSYAASVETTANAIERLRAAGQANDRGFAMALNQHGQELYRAGRYTEAMTTQAGAIRLAREVAAEGSDDIAWILHDIAELQMAAGDLDRAAETAGRSLELRRRHLPPDHLNLARSLHILARIHRDRVAPALASPLFEEALTITERIRGPQHIDTAAVLNNHGLLLIQTGDFEGARSKLERSLAIREQTLGSGHSETATAVNNLALLYWTLGDADRALALYQRVLELDRTNLGTEHPYLATTIHNIAATLAVQRRLDEALARFDESLRIRRKALGEDHPLVAQSLERKGRLHLARGELAESEEELQRSVAIFEKALGSAHPQTIGARLGLARTLLATGRSEEALQIAEAAMGASLRSGATHTSSWMGPYVLSRAYAAVGALELSVFWGKEAVNAVQALRSGVAAFDRSTQRAFTERRREVYVDLMETLVALDRIAEAQQVYVALKEEEYFDFILRDASGVMGAQVMTFSGQTEIEADATFVHLRDKIKRVSSELAVLERRARLGLTADEESSRAEARAELDRTAKEFDTFLGGLVGRFRESARPRGARDIAEVQSSQLSEGAARLQYVVGDGRLLIFITTARGRAVREQKVSAADVSRQVDAFRRAIQARQDVLPLARALNLLLLAPVEQDLKAAAVSRLELSLDGSLRYLPFGALHDGSSFLIERYSVNLIAEGAPRAGAVASRHRRDLEGFGVTRAFAGYAALPGVRRELELIRERVEEAEIYFDQDFTRDRLFRRPAGRRTLLHIATHFQFRPGTEIDSYMVLGDGTRVNLREFRLGELDVSGVRLLTLSACDTATGGGFDQTGREVEGLAAVLLGRGVDQVIATLWPVSDASTAGLLPEMYRQHVERGASGAEALRTAQLAALRGHASGWKANQSGNSGAHPFSWAGFALISR